MPTATQALVEVRASTVNRSDCGYRAADPFFTRSFTALRRPKEPISGTEFSGVVVEAGAEASRWDAWRRGLRSSAQRPTPHIRSSTTTARRWCRKPGEPHVRAGGVGSHGAPIGGSLASERGTVLPPRIVVYGASGSISHCCRAACVFFSVHMSRLSAVRTPSNSSDCSEPMSSSTGEWTTSPRTGKTYDVIFDAVGKHSYRRCRRSADTAVDLPRDRISDSCGTYHC